MKSAVTHPWLRRVSDYHSGGVSAAERAAVLAHLAECDECQQALATYRRFYALTRSPLRLRDGAAGALAEYRLLQHEQTMIPTDLEQTTEDPMTRRPQPRTAPSQSDGDESLHPPSLPIRWRAPNRYLSGLAAVAALLVVALFAQLFFTAIRPPHGQGLHISLRPVHTGRFTEYTLPTLSSSPSGIAMGRDGNLWFTEPGIDAIGRMSLTGVLKEFPLPPPGV
jgi:hypothetical protein